MDKIFFAHARRRLFRARISSRDRPADENATPAGCVARAGGVEGSGDGDTLYSGIVRKNLPYIVGARRVLVNERDAQLLRPGFDRQAQIERPGGLRQLDALAVERHFQLVVQEAGRTQPDVRGLGVNLDGVFSVERKDIPHQNSAPRAQRQTFDVIALRQVGRNAIGDRGRGGAGSPTAMRLILVAVAT